MKKIYLIARREFLETVKTRAFLFGVIFMPLIIMGAVFAIEPLNKAAQKEKLALRKIAVVDRHGGVFTPFAAQLAVYNAENPSRPFEAVRAPNDASAETLRAAVQKGDWYAYLIVPPETVTGSAPSELGRRDNQLAASRAIQKALHQAVIVARCAAQQPPIDPLALAKVSAEPRVSEIDARSGTKHADDRMTRMLTPFVFMFLIYMGTFGISMGLLTSLLEEKSTRVVEVLLAAVSPMQLMSGKILGMSAVGLLTLGVWCAVGYYSARTYNMANLVTGERLLYVGLYFLPGFLFMAALLAAIGSACNTLKEAQSMSSPLTILNVVPLMLWPILVENPHGVMSTVLSFIPPITPFVMILRICADPDTPMWQIVATLALLWATVIVMMWMAGKVFRVGVLMYGKSPTPRELLRWVRYA